MLLYLLTGHPAVSRPTLSNVLLEQTMVEMRLVDQESFRINVGYHYGGFWCVLIPRALGPLCDSYMALWGTMGALRKGSSREQW